jgi:hypothetical protein
LFFGSWHPFSPLFCRRLLRRPLRHLIFLFGLRKRTAATVE